MEKTSGLDLSKLDLGPYESNKDLKLSQLLANDNQDKEPTENELSF